VRARASITLLELLEWRARARELDLDGMHYFTWV
jgi:hypothetical protein